jgi:hypothetical protein
MNVQIVDRPAFRLIMVNVPGNFPRIFEDDLISEEDLKTDKILLIIGCGPRWIFDRIFEKNTAPVVGVFNPYRNGYMVCESKDPRYKVRSMLTKGLVQI